MNRPMGIAALLVTGALAVATMAAAAPYAGAAGGGSHTNAAHSRAGGRSGAGSAGRTRTEGTRSLSARARSLLRHRLPDALRPAAPVERRQGAAGNASVVKHTVQLATNWSGEVEQGGAFTSVSASWTVPTLTASSSLAFAATWIGIGGFSDSTLVQTGTVEVTGTGSVGYGAWVEILPTPSWTVTLVTTPGGTPSYLVAPGDAMRATIEETGTDQWLISIADETGQWTYSHTFSYGVTANSAEWITERPALFTTTARATQLATLADYGSTQFDQLTTGAGGAVSSPSRLVAIRMVDGGSVISSPGPVSSGSSSGVSFTDFYVTVPVRVFGNTPSATAAAELEHQFTYRNGECPGAATAGRSVVLATDETYPDALASAYLASSLATGTLLTPPASVSATALAAIRDEGITHVYVVGGSLAVSTTVLSRLQSTPAYECGGQTPMPGTAHVQVTRLAGPTQYDTALDIASAATSAPGSVDLSGAYAGVNGSGGDGAYNVTAGTASTSAPVGEIPTAILVTGKGFQDAEAASVLSYADRLPILLTTPSSLSAQALTGIRDLGIEQVIVMGGPYAVSDAVAQTLESDGISVLRIAGADGTQTAIELAQCELGAAATATGLGWAGTGTLTVARGDFYSDGLAGAVVAADGPTSASPEPLLLTASPTNLGNYLPAFLGSAGTTGFGGKRVTSFTILGGPGAVSQTLANTMVVSLLG
jgi:putative cell wall-binding protein